MVRFLVSVVLVMSLTSLATADDLQRVTFKVGKIEREALVHVPAGAAKNPVPVILVFHGHGETMKQAANSFDCHKHWPGAICVYPQGLPTATKSDPRGEHPGWQNEEDADRDLKFVDELLADLKKKHRIDEKRIFATGFSNGGNFTFRLWAERGDVFAAVAPCAGVGQGLKKLPPKPCLHIVGKKDGRFDNLDRVVEALTRVNNCAGEGNAWTKEAKITFLLYPSTTGTPFVSAVHPGGHEVPGVAGELIVRFFKENGRK